MGKRERLTPEDETKAPGHTCGTIDRLRTLIRKLGREAGVEPREELALLEELREANYRLRSLAGER